MTLRDVLKRGETELSEAGVPEAELNAWYLFSRCFSLERSRYFLHQEEPAGEKECAEYRELLALRRTRMPLEYIIHETEFMGLPFSVDERVLIPRQDTEILAEELLKVCEGRDVLDLCTGSGCIGISLAVLGSCRSVVLSDISTGALEAAGRNAERNGAVVSLVHSDLFENIRGRFDIIVSNPPYIPSGQIEFLMPEVRDYEPRTALDGEEDGLAFYRRIIKESRDFLRENGVLALEIGSDQGQAVSSLMERAGFCGIEIKKDLAGLDRIVLAGMKEEK